MASVVNTSIPAGQSTRRPSNRPADCSESRQARQCWGRGKETIHCTDGRFRRCQHPNRRRYRPRNSFTGGEGGGSAVNIVAASDFHHQDNQGGVLNVADDAPVADPVAPVTAEAAMQRVANIPRVVKHCNVPVHVICNAPCNLTVKIPKLPPGPPAVINSPVQERPLPLRRNRPAPRLGGYAPLFHGRCGRLFRPVPAISWRCG